MFSGQRLVVRCVFVGALQHCVITNIHHRPPLHSEGAFQAWLRSYLGKGFRSASPQSLAAQTGRPRFMTRRDAPA